MGREMTATRNTTMITKLDSLDRALAKAYTPNRRLDDLLVLRDVDPERWAALDVSLRTATEVYARMKTAHRALIEEGGDDDARY